MLNPGSTFCFGVFVFGVPGAGSVLPIDGPEPTLLPGSNARSGAVFGVAAASGRDDILLLGAIFDCAGFLGPLGIFVAMLVT